MYPGRVHRHDRPGRLDRRDERDFCATPATASGPSGYRAERSPVASAGWGRSRLGGLRPKGPETGGHRARRPVGVLGAGPCGAASAAAPGVLPTAARASSRRHAAISPPAGSRLQPKAPRTSPPWRWAVKNPCGGAASARAQPGRRIVFAPHVPPWTVGRYPKGQAPSVRGEGGMRRTVGPPGTRPRSPLQRGTSRGRDLGPWGETFHSDPPGPKRTSQGHVRAARPGVRDGARIATGTGSMTWDRSHTRWAAPAPAAGGRAAQRRILGAPAGCSARAPCSLDAALGGRRGLPACRPEAEPKVAPPWGLGSRRPWSRCATGWSLSPRRGCGSLMGAGTTGRMEDTGPCGRSAWGTPHGSRGPRGLLPGGPCRHPLAAVPYRLAAAAVTSDSRNPCPWREPARPVSAHPPGKVAVMWRWRDARRTILREG